MNERGDKREFAIAMVNEAEDAADRNDFRNVYRITKELACGRKSFDDPVKNVNGRLLIHDDEQLKRWKEHFTRVLSRITSDEVPPLADEMASRVTCGYGQFSKQKRNHFAHQCTQTG